MEVPRVRRERALLYWLADYVAVHEFAYGPQSRHRVGECPLSGVKRTPLRLNEMSAYDPFRTLGRSPEEVHPTAKR